jgi:hypothetical protein
MNLAIASSALSPNAENPTQGISSLSAWQQSRRRLPSNMPHMA